MRRTRFAKVPVVRLATADDIGRPHIVTTFVVANDVIFSMVDSKPKQGVTLRGSATSRSTRVFRSWLTTTRTTGLNCGGPVLTELPQ